MLGQRRGRVPVPAAGARVRQARAVPGRRPGRGAGLLGEGPAEDHPQPDGDQADVLPVGAADLREDLHAGHVQRRGPREAPAGGAGRRQGAPAAGRGPGGPGRAAGRLRPGRGEAVRQRAQPVRRQHPPVQHGRGADRQGDPGVLLRLRRAGDGGLRHDRDRHGRHGEHARTSSGWARWASRSRGSRRRSPRTARCCCAAPTSSRATTRTRRPRATRWSTAGCTPATWARSTRTASCSSPAARRTSSSPRAARTSRPPTWRTGSSRTAGSRRPWSSATAGPTWWR